MGEEHFMTPDAETADGSVHLLDVALLIHIIFHQLFAQHEPHVAPSIGGDAPHGGAVLGNDVPKALDRHHLVAVKQVDALFGAKPHAAHAILADGQHRELRQPFRGCQMLELQCLRPRDTAQKQ